MKHLYVILLYFYPFILCAQNLEENGKKPPINIDSLGHWPMLGAASISNNGAYSLYVIENEKGEVPAIEVRANFTNWSQSFEGVRNAYFSTDSKTLLFLSKRTIYIYKLGGVDFKCIDSVGSLMVQTAPVSNWFFYQRIGGGNDWTLVNISTGYTKKFDSVKRCIFDQTGSAAFILRRQVDGRSSLSYFNLDSLYLAKIWSNGGKGAATSDIENYFFDHVGRQMGFTTKETPDGKVNRSIWNYTYGAREAHKIVDDADSTLNGQYVIKLGYPHYFRDDKFLLFDLKMTSDTPLVKNSGVSVDIWSYHDTVLQSLQLENLKNPMAVNTFTASVDLHTDKIQLVDRLHERTVSELNDDLVIVADRYFDASYGVDFWWDTTSTHSYDLFSLKTGKRDHIKNSALASFYLSPDGRYLLYFDLTDREYYSYDVVEKKSFKISGGVPFDLGISSQKGLPKTFKAPYGVVGWDGLSKRFIVYDFFDLWELDPAGASLATCISNGYGRSHDVVLRALPSLQLGTRIFKNGESVLLTGFDRSNKYNGFFQFEIGGDYKISKLEYGPWNFYRPQVTAGTLSLNTPFAPICARDTNVWLVRRMSFSEAPNYFITTDFKSFRKISNLAPQDKVNWLTAGLIEWTGDNQEIQHAILYKPEDFNPAKKYPVIFVIYQTQADRLYDYPKPGWMNEELNIPLFVSNGYIVITPDISYQVGYTGRSACNTVASCMKYLSRFDWIDMKKVGIEGHSFGGYETNYIVSHTHFFAAASSYAGMTDLINDYGSLEGLDGQGASMQVYYETGQGRIGKKLWEAPELYIENSPVFSESSITTPLLMVNNLLDNNVPWRQGIELFTALRRLQRPVWMLQYDGEGHVISDPANQKDYTIRLKQFFDHYLKDKPAPIWMTRGIPAKYKGVELGYSTP